MTDYGKVTLNGVTYTLLDQAHADNYGTDGEIRYYANAVDEEGNECTVTWQTTVQWDEANEHYRLNERFNELTEEEIERLEELEAKTLCSIEDESYACDWDNPIAITQD